MNISLHKFKEIAKEDYPTTKDSVLDYIMLLERTVESLKKEGINNRGHIFKIIIGIENKFSYYFELEIKESFSIHNLIEILCSANACQKDKGILLMGREYFFNPWRLIEHIHENSNEFFVIIDDGHCGFKYNISSAKNMTIYGILQNFFGYFGQIAQDWYRID